MFAKMRVKKEERKLQEMIAEANKALNAVIDRDFNDIAHQEADYPFLEEMRARLADGVREHGLSNVLWAIKMVRPRNDACLVSPGNILYVPDRLCFGPYMMSVVDVARWHMARDDFRQLSKLMIDKSCSRLYDRDGRELLRYGGCRIARPGDLTNPAVLIKEHTGIEIDKNGPLAEASMIELMKYGGEWHITVPYPASSQTA